MLTVKQIMEVRRLLDQTNPRSYQPSRQEEYKPNNKRTNFEFKDVVDKKTGDVRLVRVYRN